MNIHAIKSEQQLADIVTSIGKAPRSWQGWFCLQIALQNSPNDATFGRCIARVRSFLSAYLGEAEVSIFCCQNQNIHIFCKAVPIDVLEHAAEQACCLILDEEALLTSYEIFDLEYDGQDYVSYALERKNGEIVTPISAYSALDKFDADSKQSPADPFEEKTRVSHNDLAKVLLIEDDPVTRWMVRKGLKHDCQLVTAPTANQSFDKFCSFQPDIVFLDIDLPDKSGHDVLKWIIRNDPGMSVIMFSSNNSLDNICDTLAAGARGFISKPFLREQLLHYIHGHSQ
jgi:CheY-like chemotaxis protein